MSVGFNKVFEFIFKNGYLDIFNFEPGILHFCHSVASLHLSNQFMYHMTISGKCLFGQDDWILAWFLFFVFMDRDEVSVHKNVQKKKKNSANIQPFWSHAWLIAQMNIFHADLYKSGKGRQYKKCTSEPGICLTYRSVDFLFLAIRFMRC